jgi:cobalamin biosynthesis protein CbiD
MELAIGVVLADQQKDYPAIVTISGTQPAAKTFAKGHNLVEGISPLGITLYEVVRYLRAKE